MGTRQITQQGISFCEQLIEDLSALDPVIISGFAYGVDITAQRAAARNKLQTIGCLAHGLNQIYPKSHKRYMAGIEENGGLKYRILQGQSLTDSCHKPAVAVHFPPCELQLRRTALHPGHPCSGIRKGTPDFSGS